MYRTMVVMQHIMSRSSTVQIMLRNIESVTHNIIICTVEYTYVEILYRKVLYNNMDCHKRPLLYSISLRCHLPYSKWSSCLSTVQQIHLEIAKQASTAQKMATIPDLHCTVQVSGVIQHAVNCTVQKMFAVIDFCASNFLCGHLIYPLAFFYATLYPSVTLQQMVFVAQVFIYCTVNNPSGHLLCSRRYLRRSTVQQRQTTHVVIY